DGQGSVVGTEGEGTNRRWMIAKDGSFFPTRQLPELHLMGLVSRCEEPSIGADGDAPHSTRHTGEQTRFGRYAVTRLARLCGRKKGVAQPHRPSRQTSKEQDDRTPGFQGMERHGTKYLRRDRRRG